MTTETHENSRCPKCGIRFRCGAKAGEKTCWCMALPALTPVANAESAASASCYCPQCLKALSAAKEP